MDRPILIHIHVKTDFFFFFLCMGHSYFNFRTKSLSQHKVILYSQLDNIPNPVKIAKVRKDNSLSIWSLCNLCGVFLLFYDSWIMTLYHVSYDSASMRR